MISERIAAVPLGLDEWEPELLWEGYGDPTPLAHTVSLPHGACAAANSEEAAAALWDGPWSSATVPEAAGEARHNGWMQMLVFDAAAKVVSRIPL